MQLSHYSFVIGLGAILIFAGLGLFRASFAPPLIRLAIWLILVAILVGGWYLIRPTPSAQVATLAQVDQTIGSGKPVVLEIFSEY